MQHQKTIKHELLLFCKTCTVTLLPLFVLFLFISEWVFGWMFGLEWKEAGFYLKLMLPWLFMIVLVASLSFIPDLFFKQKTAMHIEIVYVIARISTLLAGIYLNDFRLAILFYCSMSALILIVKLLWYFQLIKKYEVSLI